MPYPSARPVRVLSVAVLLTAFFTTTAAASLADPAAHVRVPRAERPANAACDDPDVPLEIVIDAFAPARRPGMFVEVFGTVTPRRDIEGLRLRFEAEGTAELFNPAPYAVGRAAAGRAVEFSVLARFGRGDAGAVHVWAESDVQQEDLVWSKRETLHAIVHNGRLYTGMGDVQRLQRIAIEDDVAAGLATPEQAKERIRAMARVPFTRHDRQPVRREFTAAEQRMNARIGADARPLKERMAIHDHHPANMIPVQGNVQWLDENGVGHPAFGAAVDIRDSDTIIDENITTTITDVDGNYEAIVDNDDGIGAGDRDIYVRIRTANSLIDTRSAGLFGGTYEASSPVHGETPSGATINENFTIANTGTGPAMSVFQAGTWIALYASDRNGSDFSQVDLISIGTHTVTLVVSDGIASDDDTLSVTVQDTTPPVIGCPLDVVVECTGNLGIQADDPQLAAFFAGASATDTCDAASVITHDAPAFLPLGQTIVTFTATDAHGNTSSCQATVTVLDTEAPTITASVTPVELWPANHKMVTIEATVLVTDECDPNPTFVLTSIVSNEPDNGLGDGDQANDIQGADYGTPDTSFELRAERAGMLTNRVYTITYTGSDSSGNTSQTQVQVTVPRAVH